MNFRRLLSLTSPLLLFSLGSVPAHADVIYSFAAFGTTATFSLPNNPTPSSVGADSFQLDDISVTITGLGPFIDNITFFDASAGGGAGSGVDVLHGPVLFGGSLMDPVMLTGSFPLSGTVTPDPDGSVSVSGTLLATQAATTPVPEPSSGLLFFTGVGAIAGALELRRRASLH